MKLEFKNLSKVPSVILAVFVLSWLSVNETIAAQVINLTTDRTQYTFGSGNPPLVTFCFANTGSTPVTITLGVDLCSDIQLQENGVQLTYRGDLGGISTGSEETIEPGKTFSKIVMLSDWTGVLNPGPHTFKATVKSLAGISTEFQVNIVNSSNEQTLASILQLIPKARSSSNTRKEQSEQRWIKAVIEKRGDTFLNKLSAALDDQGKAYLQEALHLKAILD